MNIIVGTINQVQQPQNSAPPAPPFTYLGVAQGMMPGVKALANTSPRVPVLALALLAAHVLECLLKAFISRDGSDACLKRKDVRHNLEALWEMAECQGLPIATPPPGWVISLSDLHNSPYYLRYSTGVNGVVLPAVEPMTTDLGNLMQTVCEHLG